MIEYILDFFQYNEGRPLIFSASTFWVVFAIVLLIYQFIYKKYLIRNIFLTAFSLFFYYKASGLYFILLIFSTLVDYYIGKGIYNSTQKATKKFLLVLSLISNLGMLAYFKYAYYITEVINHFFHTQFEAVNYFAIAMNALSASDFDIYKIILPVGISFFTFQTISYSIDVYRGNLKPTKSILDFAFYVTFFPQLVAGPIVRASEFLPQIYEKYHLNAEQYGKALFLILGGLFKKIFISDYIAPNFVDRVFASPLSYTGLENLMAVYGYSIQIYCDFSGYSDIAIGIGLLLGFRLPLNFNSPYKARNITDFWRRWHISLSSWLKDYLYISLGGNRSTSLFTYLFLPVCTLILLLAEGWQWPDFFFVLLIFSLWATYLKYPRNKLIAIFGINAIVLFILKLHSTSSWYLFALFCLFLIFWIIVLIAPKKKTAISTYANLSITMLLGGLWHGAHTKFIIWGGLHGMGLAFHKFWMGITSSKSKRTSTQKENKMLVLLSQIVTFHFVAFCWIFFRASSIKDEAGHVLVSALQNVRNILHQITQINLNLMGDVVLAYKEVFVVILLGFIIHFIPRNVKIRVQEKFSKQSLWLQAIFIMVYIYVLYQVKTSDIQPFIYFQF